MPVLGHSNVRGIHAVSIFYAASKDERTPRCSVVKNNTFEINSISD